MEASKEEEINQIKRESERETEVKIAELTTKHEEEVRVLKEELEKKQSEGNQQDIIDIRRQLEEAEGKLRKQLEGVESREDIIQAIEYDLSEFNMSLHWIKVLSQ